MSKQNKDLQFQCYYQNVRGLNTKIQLFNEAASVSEYVIVALTETWIQSSICSSELFGPEYIVFRADRNLDANLVTRGGGVLLAVREDCSATQIDLTQYSHRFYSIDIIGCKIVYNNVIIYVFVIYIPPNAPQLHVNNLFETLVLLDCLYDRHLLVLGDFNERKFVLEVK